MQAVTIIGRLAPSGQEPKVVEKRPRGLSALPWVRSWGDPGLGGTGAGGAVMVCESMFGSTKKVAEAIAEGLADCAEVSVVLVTSADAHILDGADLVVVDGPAHTHGMSGGRVLGRWPGSW